MEFKGRIMKVLPVESGTSQNNNEWKKQYFIFEYFEQQTDRYSDKVCLSIMNDRIAEYDLHENDEVIIGFGHSVHEYQGRYFNELRLYKFQKLTQAEPKTAQGQERNPEPNSAQAQAQAQQQAEDVDPMPF